MGEIEIDEAVRFAREVLDTFQQADCIPLTKDLIPLRQRRVLAEAIVELAERVTSLEDGLRAALAKNSKWEPGKRFVGDWQVVPQECMDAARLALKGVKEK